MRFSAQTDTLEDKGLLSNERELTSFQRRPQNGHNSHKRLSTDSDLTASRDLLCERIDWKLVLFRV
jgi:hypothetical protein